MNIEKLTPEFAVDLVALVNGLSGISYNAQVSYGNTKFDYVTLDAILAKAKADKNIAILQPLGVNEHGQTCVQTILVHKSGDVITSDYYPLRIGDNAKKQDEGAAITYTKRYAIGSFLGLCTDQDNDANPDGKGMEAVTPQKAPHQENTYTVKPEDLPFDTSVPPQRAGFATKEQIEYLSKKCSAKALPKLYEQYKIKDLAELSFADAQKLIDAYTAKENK